MGVNSRTQLAAAEAVFQRRARARALDGGASLLAPETVWFSYDTALGRDVVIEPNVFFGPGVVVEDGAHILANCHLVGTRIRTGRAHRPLCAPAPRRRHRRRCAHRQFRGGQERARSRPGQGQPSGLCRRRPRRRGRQHRRRHHLLQLRRFRQALHRCRQGRLRWVELLAGGARQDRRRRLHRLWQRHYRATWSPTRWRWSGRRQDIRPGWAAKFRRLKAQVARRALRCSSRVR